MLLDDHLRRDKTPAKGGNAAKAIKNPLLSDLSAETLHRPVGEKLKHKALSVADATIVDPNVDFVDPGDGKDLVERIDSLRRLQQKHGLDPPVNDAQKTLHFRDSLEEREILTAAEHAAIDPEMLTGFANSPLGRRIAASAEVHRETPFTYTYHLDGRDVLVQGIIDCWFVEEDGKIVLVDYKSNMHTEEIRALYQMQLDLYKEALEGLTGKKVKESYLYLLREKRLVDML